MDRQKKPISISLIVAAARNGVIGKGGAMPWHLPGDLRYFKNITLGKPVIMGQKTWESLKRKPLPQRTNIVLTRQKDWRGAGAHKAHSLTEALALGTGQALADGADEVFIIGGGEVFAQALPLVSKIYLTEIQADIEGDSFFQPDLPAGEWRKLSSSAWQQGAKDEYPYRFFCFERLAAADKAAAGKRVLSFSLPRFFSKIWRNAAAARRA